MSESPAAYLDGLPPRRRFGSRRILGIWLPLVVALLVLWSISTGPPDLPWMLLELMVLLASLGLVLWGRQARAAAPRVSRELARIERLALRGEHGAAIRDLRTLLAGPSSRYDRARTLLLLGQIAEARADFAPAAAIYAAAATELPVRRGILGMAFAQLAPVIGARRAFCLAAAGQLDEAERILDAARHRDEFPGVRALAVRARALIWARRGEHQRLVELASNEHVRIKNGLVHRDRALMRVLLGWGRSCVGGAFRAPPPPRFDGDPELRGWILRALPEAASVLEAP